MKERKIPDFFKFKNQLNSAFREDNTKTIEQSIALPSRVGKLGSVNIQCHQFGTNGYILYKNGPQSTFH